MTMTSPSKSELAKCGAWNGLVGGSGHPNPLPPPQTETKRKQVRGSEGGSDDSYGGLKLPTPTTKTKCQVIRCNSRSNAREHTDTNKVAKKKNRKSERNVTNRVVDSTRRHPQAGLSVKSSDVLYEEMRDPVSQKTHFLAILSRALC